MKRFYFQFKWGNVSSGFRYADATNEIDAIALLGSEMTTKYGEQTDNLFKLIKCEPLNV